MRKLFGYILSPIFYLLFGIIITVFHPIQWICLKLGGYKAHKKCVDVLNCFLLCTYYVLGNTVKFTNRQRLPIDRPILFVANHQSMYDIPPLIFFLRKHHGKFISKIELAKGIPSISFNLRHGGAANINRKDPKQSIAEILKLANNMKSKNWSAFIFPEGTRARTGKIKPFNVGGIATILKKVPNVLVVPVAINNSWQMVQYGFFPLNTFTRMSWEVLPPIEPQGLSPDEVVAQAETRIREKIN
ncbi:1-acyl-sn-glycerol-3-phosphate acyltransferase [Parapedobacter defluvii]|uniref:1-acyl-sn-glycerol-3-phosphate acyltransferase n=1 Tax=Parapedobacter defluvii TaxID=2045106 RepID=A0ABQ1LU66_9SPHI|nr:lysophospholipid acyltransferase family protein [Parapedobacter defluvii]GGC26782.1 1-acyl-sn-glycerol-3-phosphate acyltransferase [Parapedobacter defluvii]